MIALQKHSIGSSGRLYVKSVGSFVPKLAQKAFEKYGFSTVTLLTDWSAIAGEEIGRYCRPERLKWPRKVAVYGETDGSDKGRPGATLVLRVDPARALEIQYGADQLIERINGFFGYNAVSAIRVLQAPVESAGATGGQGAGMTTPNPKKPGVTANAGSRVDRPFGRLGDEGAKSARVNGSSVGEIQCDERLAAALKRLQATF